MRPTSPIVRWPGSATRRVTHRAHLGVLLATAMLIVAACSTAATPTGAPAIQTGALSTQSAPPAASAPATTPAPTPSPAPSGPQLTYVALGDSLLYALESDCDSCTSAAVIYGKQVEADLGIPVKVHNLTMHNGLNSSGLLAYLRDGALIGRMSEDVVAEVTAADIVSVTIGFNDFAITDKGNTKAIEERFEANLDTILARIGQLRAGKPTMVRVTLIYNNGIAESAALDPDGPGTGVDFWKPLVETQNAAICRISAKHKATCVDIYHPFNGKDGRSSPAVKGYLGPDGTHPSQLGMDTIAAALVASGYAPLR